MHEAHIARAALLDDLLAKIDRLPESEQAAALAKIDDADLRAVLAAALDAMRELAAEARSGRNPTLAAGTQVGDCVVLSYISEGSFGRVYRGEQVLPGARRPVAIKVLNFFNGGADTQRDPDVEEGFIQEVRALADLNHDNILRLISAGWYQSVPDAPFHPYIVTDWIDGDSIVAGTRGETLARKLEIFSSICRAAQAAHRRNIIHWDIKPGNILLTRTQPAKAVLLDFGLARIVEGPYVLQRPGLSLAYASPEQISEAVGPVGFHSDVYSLGVVLFEMLTGTLPYPLAPGSPLTRNAYIATVMSEARLSLRDFRGPFPDALVRAVDAALQHDPVRRIRTPGDLAAEVEGCRAALEAESRPAQRTGRKIRVSATTEGSVILGDHVEWHGTQQPHQPPTFDDVEVTSNDGGKVVVGNRYIDRGPSKPPKQPPPDPST